MTGVSVMRERRHSVTLVLCIVVFVYILCFTPDALLSVLYNGAYIDAPVKPINVKAIREVIYY